MKISEISKCSNSDLITEYVISYNLLGLNYNLHKATKELEKRCTKLEEELLKRELLTEENLKKLRQ